MLEFSEWEGSAEAHLPGAKPPGVGTLAPLVKPGEGERDYPNMNGHYILRPEVRLPLSLSSLC